MTKTPTPQAAEAAALKAIYQAKKKADPSLTQEAIAERAGWTGQSVVSQYLNGRIPLNLSALLKFASILNFDPAQVSSRLASQLALPGHGVECADSRAPASDTSEHRSNIRRTNLALLLETQFDGNKSALGRAVGRQAGYVAGMLPDSKSARSFGESNARDFEQRLGLPLGWLDRPHASVGSSVADGEESSSKAPTQVDLIPIDVWSDETPLGDDEVEIPFFKEVELAAGKGSEVMLETGGRKLRFGKRTLQRKGIPPEAAAAAVVTGNSMEPVLPDGSTVGVDTSYTQVSDGKMYAISHEGQLRVKVLYRLPGNGLRLRSYNSDEHPDERYDGPYVAEHIRIIGKVFWYSVLI